jgi:hypothetical protein
VTLDTQAQYTADAWTLIKRWPYVSAATLYGLRNTGTKPTSPQQNLFPDLDLRPSGERLSAPRGSRPRLS